ncbi:MAG: Mrp/NBP35 family ATP-binding protein [Fibrobacterota bacterium]
MSHAMTDESKTSATLSGIKKRYIVLSGKGGVGKSTVAANLAVALAKKGFTTGLLDTDLHGPSIPKMLGLTEFVGMAKGDALEPAVLMEGRLKVMSMQFMLPGTDDAVIWRGPLKHSVISQFIANTDWGTLDYLIIDSPPGTGDEPLSAIQTAKPHGAIIVTTPQSVATFDVRKSIDFCRKLSLPITGIVENMSGFVCPHCHKNTYIFGSQGGETMAHELGERFLGRIPIEPDIVTLSDNGKTFVAMAPESAPSMAISEITALL